MNDKLTIWITIILTALSIIAGTGWIQFFISRYDSKQSENNRLIKEQLAPIERLLQDNKIIYDELYKDYIDSKEGKGILEHYLKMIRKDGIEKHSVLRERINTLVQNNQKILMLLDQYSGYICSEKFSEQSGEFRNHALRYKNRWDAIPGIYKTSKAINHALPFPKGFPKAIKTEIKSKRQNKCR